MNGPELKVRLGGLGLPPSWFAERMNVTMRTVVRWFDGEDVAPNVTAELTKLSNLTIDEMRKQLAKIPDGPDSVTLKTYRTDDEFKSKIGWPASWHRALTFRLVEHFEAQDKTVKVEYR